MARILFLLLLPLSLSAQFTYTLFGPRIGSSLFIPANQTISYPLQGVSAGICLARFTLGQRRLRCDSSFNNFDPVHHF